MKSPINTGNFNNLFKNSIVVIHFLQSKGFCIGCTYTLLNEKDTTVSAKSTKETIMIDAGHGGYDVGSISNYDDYEKDINLQIALLVGKQLKSYGFEVVYTRTGDSVSWSNDNTEDLQTRCDLAKKKECRSLCIDTFKFKWIWSQWIWNLLWFQQQEYSKII